MEYQYLRNLARKAGMELRKSRSRFVVENFGGYYLVDPETRGVVAGAAPRPGMLDSTDVENICNQEISLNKE